MRLLIVSDVHAMSKDLEVLNGYVGGSGALLRVENRLEIVNPLLSIRQALKSFDKPIDALLCLGDIAHQGKRSPLMIAWADLHHVASSLKIASVIGITGNHDILSRANNAEDVEDLTEFIRLLRPAYPSADNEFNRDYFADGVASTVYGDCLFVGLNTCRTHGLGLEKEVTQKLFDKGVLTDAMIEKVVDLVSDSELDHVVIAMHHHPLSERNSPPGDDPIPKGNVLIEQLEALGKNILLLHGHQHRVVLHKPSPSPKSPYILSCASLCALPYPGQHTDFSNQFHVVELNTTISDQPTGSVLTWDWGANGWQKSARLHMPHEVNFGPAIDVAAIGSKLRALPLRSLYKEKDLLELEPHLKYLTRRDVDELNRVLAKDGRQLVVEAGRIRCLLFEEDYK